MKIKIINKNKISVIDKMSVNRPSAFGENIPSQHLKNLLGIMPKQSGNNNEDKVGHKGQTRSSAGIQMTSKELIEPNIYYNNELVNENYSAVKSSTINAPGDNLGGIITQSIRDAFGIRVPVMGFKPLKESRDLNRLISINRKQENKTWSREEIEYYNRKGSVDYVVKNVENKPLPNVFNPLAPPVEYTSLSGSAILANKPQFTTYS